MLAVVGGRAGNQAVVGRVGAAADGDAAHRTVLPVPAFGSLNVADVSLKVSVSPDTTWLLESVTRRLAVAAGPSSPAPKPLRQVSR